MPLLSTRGAASARGFGLLGRIRAITDPFFNYVTLLLRGDGTNGAQNGSFVDTSSNNYAITSVGKPTQVLFSPYASNWSNLFANSSSNLTVNTSTGTGTWTAECWVFITSPADARTIFGQGTSDDTGGWLFWVDANGTIRFYSNGNIAISSSGAVASNTWVHLALVSNSSNVTIYVNGTSVATGSYSGKTFTNTPFQINRGYGGSTAGIDGYISNARLVVGTAVYTANFTPSTTPLTVITNTRLLTCADNRFIDDSSNNFTITRNGDVRVQVFSPFAPPAPYGATTTAGSVRLLGDNSNQDCLTAPAAAFDVGTATNFTLEFWLNIDNWNTYNQFVGQWGTYSTFQFSVLEDRICVQDPSGTCTTSLFTSAIRTRAWNHFALVRQGSTCTVYLNGVGFALSRNPNISPNGAQNVGIGRVEDQTGYGVRNAFMAGFRMVKGTAIYTSNFVPPTTPPTAVTNTSLLLNFSMPGIVDSSAQNVVYPQDNAQINTSVKKFGTGSIRFDGSGDVLLVPGSNQFVLGNSNFTIEGWFNSNSFASEQGFVARYEYFFGSFQGYVFSIPNSTTLRFTRGDGIVLNGSVSAMSTGTWYYIAAVRNGSTLTLYLNGVQVAQATGIGNFSDARFDLEIGNSMNGYIDDLRITKGVARYTANFTPPTAAFPNQ